MKTPFCAIAINDVSQMTCTNVLTQGDTNPQVLAFALHEFNAEGLDAASMRLGKMIFTIMTLWYPDAMAHFPHLKIPYSAKLELHLISLLVANSITHSTTVHIPSIQLLVDQVIEVDPAGAEQDTIKKWPETKAMLAGLARFENLHGVPASTTT